MEIQMGHLCFGHMCVVVDTVDKVLLGEDHLLCDSSGPTEIIQFKEKMMFRGATIPLKMVRPSIESCVTVAESVEVPSMERVIVDAYKGWNENQEGEEESWDERGIWLCPVCLNGRFGHQHIGPSQCV